VRRGSLITRGSHCACAARGSHMGRRAPHSAPVVSNTRGTCSIAHWDVPDCGNTEFFVNLQPNAHLDEAYGESLSLGL
jgi:cyclophilin family peptidyl-prolyl cis-trans isomerase